jgi:LuxR family transcriptional regulator, maltose regulon positive regulatory protein
VKRMTQLESVPGGIAVTMEPAVAAGKFRVPPPGADVLRRDRLTTLIEQATERPVTVITAPPGAGKTVAAAGWAAARARSRRIAWLSLDEGDRDPGRFWACMTAALAAGGAAGGTPLVPRGRDAADDLPADLVNAVRRLSGSLVLVIDDVHTLAGSDVLPELALLIHQAPTALRLILCGRFVPGLHLAKMRLSGALSEVRAADLACTPEEAEAYFDHLGLAAGPAERAALLRQTEGWMAGPRLAALIAVRDGGLNVDDVASDPVVAEYIRDEVLDWQPPRVRQFLRQTSIAERVTAGFADLVTGEPDSARLLDQLQCDNSLVARDGQDGYRYHPFLRQVLLGELRCETPAELPGLFSRAARWYAARGEVIEAVRCVAESGLWEQAPPLLTEAGLAGALTDRVAEFETVLGRLPARWRADPAVAAALAMTRLYRGDPDSAEAYLTKAAPALLDTVPDRLVIDLWLATSRLLRQPDMAAVASCLPLAERARATAGRQHEHQAAGLLWMALGTVLLRRWQLIAAAEALTAAHHQLTAAGTAGLAARVRGWLALTAALSGDLETASDLSGQLLGTASASTASSAGASPAAASPAAGPVADPGDPLTPASLSGQPAPDPAAEPGPPPGPAACCLASIAAAQTAVDRDDLMGAARLLKQAEPLVAAPLPGEPDMGVLLAAARARVALAESDLERARDLVRLVRDKYETDGAVLSALDFDVALRAGDLALAATALRQAPPAAMHPGGEVAAAAGMAARAPGRATGEAAEPDSRPDQLAARARLLLAEGDPATALELARDAARDDPEGASPAGGARPRPTRRDRVTALLAGAIAARRTGTDSAAARLLEEALAIAEPQDLYRPFLDAGGAVHSAIALLVAPASPVAGFAARVHERFVCQPSSRAAGNSPAEHEASALTASELAVLRLLRSYMSNQDIADTLFLSVNTVKTHLRSVYYKLGVSSRREAVERGVRLRIL